MTVRTWGFGTGDWSDPTQWLGGAAPLPDDTVVLDMGIAVLTPGETVDADTIEFGGVVLGEAILTLDDARLGYRTTLDASGVGSQGEALLADIGNSGYGGVIEATDSGGTFEIDASNTTAPGDLTLLSGSTVDVAGGDLMLLFGSLNSRGDITIGGASAGTFINDGTIAAASAAFEVESGGTLGGDGTFEIGLYSSLNFQAGSAASDETVRFVDVGGRLLLADPGNFAGTIDNFQTGDLIDLTSIVANGANYDPGNGVLTVTENDSVVATLTLDGAAGDGFFTAPDTAGGTLVELDGAQTRLNYTIDAADRAMDANVVRATMTAPGGVPITGAGVRIGVISNSFDEAPGIGAADVANAAAAAGYLPTNPDGTSAVTVLSDATGSGDDNEGLAMAELVHQVAPGASIDFATGEGGSDALATAVTALQQAGCNIIVDDLYDFDEPFFQDAGAIDGAIDDAVAQGVSYFTSAGNVASDAYQATFTATTESLYDGTVAPVQQFSDGSPYQTVTLVGGVAATFDLEWAMPWLGAGESTGSVLQMKLFDGSGDLVASSTLDGGGGNTATEPQTRLSYTPGTTQQYQLAIYGSVAAGTVFKYILIGQSGGGTNVAGSIDDPAANAGTVMGHAMLPEVTTVGAVDFSDTPEFGQASGYTTYYSSTGDAEFLFDQNGNPIDDVVAKPNLVAPVDAATSLTALAPFNGTSAAAPEAAAVAALMLQADPKLTPAQIQTLMENSATSLGQPADAQGAGSIDAEAAVQLALDAAAACYAAGARLATSRGLVAIERLRLGDLLVTAGGALRPVMWLGHRRVECRRHRRPSDAWPVRVQAHAFAPQRPARDLLLSPDHAVKVGDALVPIRYLVNGATVAQLAVPSITYWHVELPSHDVVLAEGLACESYLDTGNRSAFANGGAAVALHPDFSRRVWAEQGCAPLLVDGPAVAEQHARLRARALRLGHRASADPGLTARADGRQVAVHRDEKFCRLQLPPGTSTLRLLSHSWVPAHFGEPDTRRLGVAIGGLAIDGRAVAFDDPRLAAGWHEPEAAWRWTDGAATLVTDGARYVTLEVRELGKYWKARGAAPRPRRGREAPDP